VVHHHDHHRGPSPVEVIEVDSEPSTLQPSTLDVRDVSVSSSSIPRVPVTEEEEEAQNNHSYSLGPSWAFASTTQGQHLTRSEDEAGGVGGGYGGGCSGVENPNIESQLSEKARGKKRMREEDYTSDDEDDAKTVELLLEEGCGSGSSSSSCDRDGQHDRKRTKTDADTDTSTESDAESWRPVKKLREIERLYRSGRLLL